MADFLERATMLRSAASGGDGQQCYETRFNSGFSPL
jgi:hypothetical protein